MKSTASFGEQSVREEGQNIGEWHRMNSPRYPMRDEGDMIAGNPPINCRAILIASVVAWAVLALVAVCVLKLFHYA